MANLFIVFGLVVLAKFVLNLSRYLACIRYHKIYETFLGKPDWKIEEVQPQIANLFKDAGLEASSVPYVQPVGYDRIITATVSTVENIGTLREDVVLDITAMFHRAKGIYRNRMLEAINPLYWLQYIIFLPKNLLQYIGAKPESAMVRFAQVIYWFLGIIGMVLISVFPNEINAYIKSVLGIP